MDYADAATQPKPRDDLVEFHLHEYDSVKDELLEQVKNLSIHFHYAILVTSGVFAWLLTHGPTSVPQDLQYVKVLSRLYDWSLCIPAAITVLFFFQTFSAIRRIDRASAYLASIENRFALVGFGFERMIDRKHSSIRKSIYASWILLFAFDVFLAIALTQRWSVPWPGY